ncbi:MAG TPA: hypothetical protein EYQ86_03685 [Bacteroidetes bacterium]|nr:hypothetical protein [Bacteroidota bacterium]
MPEYMGGYLKPGEVDRSLYKKFDISLNNYINIYVFSQYAIMLGFTNVFLFFHSEFTPHWIPFLKTYLPTPKWFLALLIFFSVWNLGKLLEKRIWAFWTELARWVFIVGVYYFLIVNIAGELYSNVSYSLYFDLGIFVFIGIALISCSSLIYIRLKNS